ncbi:aarF domain-containing protein kinase 1 isoform X1 [Paramormyrops kingsleyae]|uniref:aarF domain-containing protein kinase 1 isoform X1 n=1 Tax=Paramormyrops kingsleyae TaxID=1676925 RepID=UPI003B977679
MAGRLLKVSSAAAALLASSGLYLYGKHLDPSDVSVVRFGRAAATTAVISYDYLTSLRNVQYGTEEYWALKSKVHRRSAERLRDLCCANRGTFIKVGQHLGALDYLLPEEYTSVLRELHSRSPQSSIAEVQQVIREDLGKEGRTSPRQGTDGQAGRETGRWTDRQKDDRQEDSQTSEKAGRERDKQGGFHSGCSLFQIRQLFASFEDTPQGAASLAQVHKALLHDGRTVAVKVQHPKVQTQSSRDIVVIEVLLKAVKWLFPDFSFMWLVEEAKKNMPLELDFLNEGRNAEKVAELLKDFKFLKVPKIHWDLSTKRILTMDFMEGGQVNDREYMRRHSIDVNEISRNLGKMYSEMIFVHGFVHCDPHPGNVLVRKCPKSKRSEIVLLDHGLYQVLNQAFRLDYCRLWRALMKADMKGVERYSRRLGAGDMFPLFACVLTARSWASLNAGISRTAVTSLEDTEIRANAARYLPQISELLNKVPRQMLLLLKTNDLLRGIETVLQTRANASSFLNMSRCCVRALSRHGRSKARYRPRWLQIFLSEVLTLWQINLYEVFLWMKASMLGSWLRNLVSWLQFAQ